MSIPKEQITIVNIKGEKIDIDHLISEIGTENKRILVDDEIGKVIYVGDLELYSLKPIQGGNYLAEKVLQIRRIRFGTTLIRKQIGGTVLSVTSDTVFLVKEKDYIRKVRADALKKGMILASGEKVFS